MSIIKYTPITIFQKIFKIQETNNITRTLGIFAVMTQFLGRLKRSFDSSSPSDPKRAPTGTLYSKSADRGAVAARGNPLSLLSSASAVICHT